MLTMQKKLSNSFLAILALPAAGLGFALSVQISALSKYSLDIHDIGLVWAAGPIAGIFGQVIIGAWSDRIWLWGGRRRPFILVGGTIAALTLLAILVFQRGVSVLHSWSTTWMVMGSSLLIDVRRS